MRADGAWPEGLWEGVLERLAALEERTGRRLGDPEKLLRKHKSGGLAHRAFCSQCGSSLFAIDDDGKNMSVTITTLDRPNLHRPEAVGYGGMAPRWLPTAALKKSSP
jgi:hypothetical protein